MTLATMSKFESNHSILNKNEAQNELVCGIQSLDKAIELLCKAEINGTTAAETVKDIAQSMGLPINQAHKHFTAVMKYWKGKKARLCEKIEVRLTTINSVRNTVSKRQMKVERINRQFQDVNRQINHSEQNVVQAKSALSSAQQTLGDAEEKLKRKKKQRNIARVGGFLSFVIPVVGPVLGAGLLVATVTTLEDDVKSAKSGVSAAECNVRDCESRLQTKTSERKNIRQQLSEEENQKQKTEQELRNLELQLQNLQNAQRRSVKFSDKLMRTCHAMTNIWGKSQVLNNAARLAYALEPLLTPLKEIVDMFTPEEQRKIKENTFLLSSEVDFSGISLKLKAVAEVSDGSSVMAILDDYL